MGHTLFLLLCNMHLNKFADATKTLYESMCHLPKKNATPVIHTLSNCTQFPSSFATIYSKSLQQILVSFV